jgi:hypothetical protein
MIDRMVVLGASGDLTSRLPMPGASPDRAAACGHCAARARVELVDRVRDAGTR